MRSQIHELQALSDEADVYDRNAHASKLAASNGAEETLILDARSVMRPADFVEHKFQRALRDSRNNDPALS
jgi:hypothetical protein